MTKLYIDFEMYYEPKGGYSVKRMPVWQFLRDPRFQLLGAAVAIPGTLPPRWLGADGIVKLLQRLPRNLTMVAHNVAFDAAVAYHVAGYEPEDYACTVGAATYLISQGDLPPDSEVNLASLAPLVGMQKGDTATALGAGGQTTIDYALNDLAILIALDERLSTSLPELERRIIDYNARMTAIPSLAVDTALLTRLSEPIAYPDALTKLCRSRDKFARVLEAYGVDVEYKVSSKTGKPVPCIAKTDNFMRSLLQHANPKVVKLAELRLECASNLVRTRSAKLLSVGAPLSLPSRYFAAHTGRSGGSQSLNALNLPPKIRPAIQAPEGYKLVIGDSSQIELRQIAQAAGQEDLLATLREGRDPYVEFASQLYATSERSVTDDQRQVAKIARLALIYQMGADALVATAAARGLIMLPKVARRIVDVFRDTHPYIVAYWARLFACAVRDQCVKLPSGRQVLYPGLELEGREASFLRPLIFSRGTKREKTKLFPGAVAENATQAAARDIVLWQTTKLAQKYRVVQSVYDEVVLLVPDEQAEEALKDVLSALAMPPAWEPTIPLAGKAVISQFYTKP